MFGFSFLFHFFDQRSSLICYLFLGVILAHGFSCSSCFICVTFLCFFAVTLSQLIFYNFTILLRYRFLADCVITANFFKIYFTIIYSLKSDIIFYKAKYRDKKCSQRRDMFINILRLSSISTDQDVWATTEAISHGYEIRHSTCLQVHSNSNSLAQRICLSENACREFLVPFADYFLGKRGTCLKS